MLSKYCVIAIAVLVIKENHGHSIIPNHIVIFLTYLSDNLLLN